MSNIHLEQSDSPFVLSTGSGDDRGVMEAKSERELTQKLRNLLSGHNVNFKKALLRISHMFSEANGNTS